MKESLLKHYLNLSITPKRSLISCYTSWGVSHEEFEEVSAEWKKKEDIVKTMDKWMNSGQIDRLMVGWMDRMMNRR